MDWYPLKFEPILKAKSWGGRRLETALKKALRPGEQIGESWEVSDFADDLSVVAEGPLKGRSLRELIDEDASAILGRPLRPEEGGRFPLLAKYIDAKDILSLQVHPDDEMARRLPGGHRGKTECWYVVDADPGSTVFLGLRPAVTREEFADALRSEDRERIEGFLSRMEVHPGDFIYAPAGMVHAVGAGMLFAEVSQTSDSTLRLYDWGRLPRRPTHIDDGLRALDLPDDGLGAAGKYPPDPIAKRRSRLVHGHVFTVDLIRLPADASLRLDEGLPCAVWMTVAGGGNLIFSDSSMRLEAGQALLLPAGDVEVEVVADDDLTILAVEPS